MTHDLAVTLREIADEVDRLRRIVTLTCEAFDGGDTLPDDLPGALGEYMTVSTARAAREAAELRSLRAANGALRAELDALRAERAPPPEPAASERVAWVTYPGDSGPVLHIDGRERGNIVLCDDGTWLASALGAPQVLAIPDEPTARAVLLALAGEDPGVTVALSLRASWTREDVDRARDAGPGIYVAQLLEGYAEGWDGAQHTEQADVIRAWVAGGQGLMTLRVVEESADGCPF